MGLLSGFVTLLWGYLWGVSGECMLVAILRLAPGAFTELPVSQYDNGHTGDLSFMLRHHALLFIWWSIFSRVVR